MAFNSFITGERVYKQLGEAWKIRGAMKDMTIRLEYGQVVTADVTHLVKKSEADELVETLSQYQLIPGQPWTWVTQALPLYDEESTLHWTWDGRTIALREWNKGIWEFIIGPFPRGMSEGTTYVLAWQPLAVPPAPAPRKDQV